MPVSFKRQVLVLANCVETVGRSPGTELGAVIVWSDKNSTRMVSNSQNFRDELAPNVPLVYVSRSLEVSSMPAGFKNSDALLLAPFSKRELVLTLKLVQPHFDTMITPESTIIQFDHLKMLIEINDEQFLLTPNEFRILAKLARHSRQAVSFATLSSTIGLNCDADPKTVRGYVSQLKSKVSYLRACIQSIENVGYRLDADVAFAEVKSKPIEIT